MTSNSTAHRASTRFSTYSGAPSLHPSIAPTTNSTTTMSNNAPIDSARNTMIATKDAPYKLSAITYESEKIPVSRATSNASSVQARNADLREWSAVFDRMQDKRLEQQRYVVSGQKNDEISTNALGAKLERALGRRMSGQDATFTRRGSSMAKKPMEVTAA